MKNTILQIIAKYPKHYSRMIQDDPTLLGWVNSHSNVSSDDIRAKIYSAIHQINDICPIGKTKKFLSITRGFGYCGRRSSCECIRLDNNAKITNTASTKSSSDWSDISSKAKKTKEAKYGDENYNGRDKAKQTSLEKFGKEFPTQSQVVKDQIKTTNIHRHGVEWPTQKDDFQSKAKKTKEAKYGDENYNGRDKAAATNVSRYGSKSYLASDNYREECFAKTGFNHWSQVPHIKQNQSAAMRATLHNKDTIKILDDPKLFGDFILGKSRALAAYILHIDPTTVVRYAKKYQCEDNFIYEVKSKWEHIIKGLLENLSVSFIVNDRSVLQSQELDFYLPDHNIAIELNGNYWHSEIAGGKSKTYHYNKWKDCRNKGITLYSWFEDELTDNIDIVNAKVRYITHQPIKVIGARKTSIGDVSLNEERQFLCENHIQGSTNARNKTIGAFHNGQLVAVFSWLLRKQYLEITRYACDMKASYPGLFSKMMRYMVRETKYIGDIVSFSNNGHSDGGVYKASGFHIDKIIGPAYWYTKNYKSRENRQKYMKSKIAKKFGIDMSHKTEWEAMQELGYDRIWDSGKIKWVLENAAE